MMHKLIKIEDFKLSGIYAVIVTPIINLVAPVQHLFMPLIWLVVIDIISGIYKNRIKKKQPITSKKFFERKSKVVLVWTLGLLTMLLADKFLLEVGIDGHWAAKVYCVWYALYEVISILENLGDSGLPGAKNILKLLRGRLPNNIDTSLNLDVKIEDKNKEDK